MKWEEIGVNDPRYKAKNFLKTVSRLQKRIRAVTGEYMRFVDISEYKGDSDLLCEGIWLELLSKPVGEVCAAAVEEWKENAT